MDALGFVLFILACGGVAALMFLRGQAWKDFTDSVTDKKE